MLIESRFEVKTPNKLYSVSNNMNNLKSRFCKFIMLRIKIGPHMEHTKRRSHTQVIFTCIIEHNWFRE